MESSEQNGTSISEVIYATMLFLASRTLRCCSLKISQQIQ